MCVWCVCVCVCGGEGTSGAQNAAWSGASTQSTVIISISIIGITITSQSASSPRAGHAGAMRRLTSAPPPNDDPPGGDQKNPSLMPKQLPRVCCVCCACVCVCARGGGASPATSHRPRRVSSASSCQTASKGAGVKGRKTFKRKEKNKDPERGKGGRLPWGCWPHTRRSQRERGEERGDRPPGREQRQGGALSVCCQSCVCVCFEGGSPQADRGGLNATQKVAH